MEARVDRRAVRRRIRYRIRAKLGGTAARPRLAIYRSDKHIYVQAIDDQGGRTIAQASTTLLIYRRWSAIDLVPS